MNNTLAEARVEHFQRKLDQRSIWTLEAEIRRVDGTTAVRRDELLTARARILRTAAQTPGQRVVGGMATVPRGVVDFRIGVSHAW
jgi:hypothetical protein